MDLMVTSKAVSIAFSDDMVRLNDIHEVMGGDPRKSPSRYLRSDKALALSLECGIRVVKGGGGEQGTYSSREVAIDYICFIAGPKARLEVLRAVSGFSQLLDAIKDLDIPDDLPDMFIYVIREKDSGRVKVGISKDPQKRMRQLQTGNASELELIYTKKADNRFKDEAEEHRRLSNHHIHGEWFSAGATLEHEGKSK